MVNQLLDQYHADGVNQIYWVEIEFSTKMAWRFYVYIPPGNSTQLNYAVLQLQVTCPLQCDHLTKSLKEKRAMAANLRVKC